jgi:hypothetical protein
MTFGKAMDLLCLSAGEVADLFGVAPQTVRQMRLEPGTPAFRTPPDGWRSEFAQIARQRGAELERLARELEGTPGV